jgi:hypothetical protein
MRKAVLKDLCLCQYNHWKLLVLRTDFSTEGFGYIACQPADNDASMQAIHQCMQGGSFNFMAKDSTALLHPVAFGCRRTRGNEERLHSHLGKAFVGDVAINKCHHMCFAQQFVWVTDCYALKFISSYDSWNTSILRLQMQFMCWDMIIKHCNDACLTNADYFSQLGANLCSDSLLKDYVQHAHALCCRSQCLSTCPLHQNFSRISVAHASTAQNHSLCHKDPPCMPTLQPSQLPPSFSTCTIGQCHSVAPLNLWTPAMLRRAVSTTPNLTSCKYVSSL